MSNQYPTGVWLGILGLIVVFVYGSLQRRKNTGPPWLRERVPWISNTWQYLTNMQAFLESSG